MVYNFFHKKSSGSGIKNENTSNQRLLDLPTRELAEDKPIIRKFKKRKLHSLFIENILDADLTNSYVINKESQQSNSFFIICYWYVQQISMGYSIKR